MPMDPSLAPFMQVIDVQSSAFMGATPRSLLSRGVVPRQWPTQFAISPSSHLRLRYLEHFILDAIKLLKARRLTLMTPNLSGWERFPTLGPLTHIRISPMMPQVPGVTLGSPLCPWFCGHFSWRGAWQLKRCPLVLAWLWPPSLYVAIFSMCCSYQYSSRVQALKLINLKVITPFSLCVAVFSCVMVVSSSLRM
jgi:hypothetical protein